MPQFSQNFEACIDPSRGRLIYELIGGRPPVVVFGKLIIPALWNLGGWADHDHGLRMPCFVQSANSSSSQLRLSSFMTSFLLGTDLRKAKHFNYHLRIELILGEVKKQIGMPCHCHMPNSQWGQTHAYKREPVSAVLAPNSNAEGLARRYLQKRS